MLASWSIESISRHVFFVRVFLYALLGAKGQSYILIQNIVLYPILQTQDHPYVWTLMLPSLNSEMGWTGNFWSMIVFLK